MPHTPGPWKQSMVDETLVQSPGRDVAQALGDYDRDDDWPEMEANARLISAAPDLLDALEAILPDKLCGESWNLPDNESVQIVITFGELRAARTAVAKARGETTN